MYCSLKTIAYIRAPSYKFSVKEPKTLFLFLRLIKAPTSQLLTIRLCKTADSVDPGPEKPALQTLSKASKLGGYLEMVLNS